MFQLINNILHDFRKCFNRERTWRWFVVLVMGFMIRTSNRGVTSIISAMRLKPSCYPKMLHFFRSTAYKTEFLYEEWAHVAMRNANIVRIAGRVVMLGDHSKVPKEGRHMPDVQMHHQDSQNSCKPEYIAGHNYGQVSAVITNGTVSRSLPMVTRLQKSPPKKEGTNKPDGDTLVVQMVKLVHRAAQAIGEPVVVALDAYFSSESAWSTAENTITQTGDRLVEIVTRAQTNTVAFHKPKPRKQKGPGAPRKYGAKVTLYDYFSDLSKFTETEMVLYGQKAKVKYLCLDLLWKPVKKRVRFVAVESGSGRCVLMSTSLTMSAEDIISIYGLRFKIETSFDDQKNDVGCFNYHFWTSAQPKFKKWKKVEAPTEEELQARIESARKATESFVCLSTIGTGIMTIIAFTHSCDIWDRYPGWIRTLRSTIPTISIVKETLYQDYHELFPRCEGLSLYNIITPLRRIVYFLYKAGDNMAA